MKKYITVAALLAAGTAFANAYETATFEFGGLNVPESGATSYELTVSGITVTVSASGALTSGTWTEGELTTAGSTDFWAAAEEAGLSITELQAYTPSDWIGGSTKSDSLSITISGLEANVAADGYKIDTNATYTVALLSGLPFEGAGAWNSLTTTNDYATATPALGGESIAVRNTVTGFVVEDIVTTASGEISFTVNAKGAHTAVLNGLAIVKTADLATSPVPEPSAFGLLAGIGALALVASRRRRK